MPHRLIELLDLPGNVLGAIGVIIGGMVTGAVTLLAQLPAAAGGVVTEAPTWFLGFGALVVIALAWACLTLARYAAITQNTSNEQVKASMDQQTKVLTNLAATIERQNNFWERAGITAITRSMDAECDFPSSEQSLAAVPCAGVLSNHHFPHRQQPSTQHPAMKNIILLLTTAACLLLPSCVTKGQPSVDRLDPQKLAKLGNIALTVANKRGVVSDKDAAMARAAGVLILEAEASETPLAAISETAVAIAVREGSLTPEEAELLREVGTVLLKPEAPPAAAPLTVP